MTCPCSVYFMHQLQRSIIKTECYASYLQWRHAICSTCFVTESIKFYGKQVRVEPSLTARLSVLVINILGTLRQNSCSIAENKTRKTQKEFDKCRVKCFSVQGTN